ncbi:DoxX family protein [Rhodococcus sp. NPDC058481]|uniref:DoxX family protein n=1 Tax=unclassified Rhodococcus (in: high G+C Gram-positive bacteria) TaxID=192944 RepID=UPI003657D6DB
MNVALWIVAGILAVMFAMAGVMKSTQAKDTLAEKLPWVADVSTGTLRLIGVAALILGLGAAPAHAYQVPDPAVPPAKVVGPGTKITFDNYTEYGFWCTLGAVGTDSAGRKVGITAGHCNPKRHPDNQNNDPDHTDADGNKTFTPIVGPEKGIHTLTNEHRVWDHRNVGDGPIGHIRWVSKDDTLPPDGSAGTRGGYTDYMVIEFTPNVSFTTEVKNAAGAVVFRQNSLHTNAAGAPTVPNDYQEICRYGATSDNYKCGFVTATRGGLIQSWAPMQGGDSGGPAILQGTSKWTGIVTRLAIHFPPYVYTSAKNILGDLNGQPDDVTGKGFTIFSG